MERSSYAAETKSSVSRTGEVKERPVLMQMPTFQSRPSLPPVCSDCNDSRVGGQSAAVSPSQIKPPVNESELGAKVPPVPPLC